jgi:(p)ppGpp synthase/HD superfamily hydrolase
MKPTLYNHEANLEFDKAIRFVAVALETTGRNPKPVVLHSVRTGLYLREQGYSKEIVLAGFLHDVLEDSATKPADIRATFGETVCALVEAVSYNESFKDREKAFQDVLARMIAAGPAALIVSAADGIDNLPYTVLAGDPDLYTWLREKMSVFLKESEPLIGKEPPWIALNKGFNQLPLEIANEK